MKYVAVLTALMFVASAAAAGAHLSDPGTTPDSPFYGFDRAMESISLALSFSAESKARKKLDFAEERLAEAEAMMEKNKSEKAYRATEEYTKQLREVERIRAGAEEASRIQEMFSNESHRHMSILHRKNVIPGNPLYTAKKEAEGFAVSTETDPVRKVEIQAKIVSHRVGEIRQLVERNRSRDASRVAREFLEERKKLGEIVNTLNRSSEREEAAEILENATRHHQQVLENVRSLAPEQAMEGLEKALNASSKRFENIPGLEVGPGSVPSGPENAPNSSTRGRQGNAPGTPIR